MSIKKITLRVFALFIVLTLTLPVIANPKIISQPGTLKWKLKVGDGGPSTIPAIGKDRIIYGGFTKYFY